MQPCTLWSAHEVRTGALLDSEAARGTHHVHYQQAGGGDLVPLHAEGRDEESVLVARHLRLRG
jgi:hypothetical protein